VTAEEAWLGVARECPCRVLAALHRAGEYEHGTTPRYPGKVLCRRRGGQPPEGWAPTPAQQRAWQVGPPAQPPLPAEPGPAAAPTGVAVDPAAG
jgi:hypothetical protein